MLHRFDYDDDLDKDNDDDNDNDNDNDNDRDPSSAFDGENPVSSVSGEALLQMAVVRCAQHAGD